MKMGRASNAAGLTQVVVVTADPAFEASVRATFGASEQIALRVAEMGEEIRATSPASR